MDSRQECRAAGLRLAILAKGEGTWQRSTLMRWAHEFAHWIETGDPRLLEARPTAPPRPNDTDGG